jgi:adenylate cyclase
MPPPSLKFPWHHTKAVASARFSGTPPGGASRNRLLTFRTTVTLAVMALITSLALCLILVQYLALRAATQEAASAYMDATTTTTVDALRAELVEIGGIVRVLATNPFLADSDDRSEIGGAVDLFKVALRELPQADSLYVAYDNGGWLQVRGLATLDPAQRQRLSAPAGAAININLIRPTADGELPLRRIFEDEHGDKIEQLDLWDYGYDARRRPWYQDTLAAKRSLVSPPYASFSLGVPMITLSAPLHGKVRGVIAADLKLDSFSKFVSAHRPGANGTAILFDPSGRLLAHPEFPRLIDYAMTHPAHPNLPTVTELRGGVVSAVIKGWHGEASYEGDIRGDDGHDYLFRLRKVSLGDDYDAYLLLVAASDDFVHAVRSLQTKAIWLAVFAGGCFLPLVWIFGGGMSRSLQQITAQAARVRLLAAPDIPVRSVIREIDELGMTVSLAQRAVWSFARFVPKEIVRGVIDGVISAELGGTRREVSILFTDVQNFTGIAEAAEPDVLMRQASRHFAALCEAFLAEGGTIDKFIGDAVMVFWNAPRLQPDHVERACRAALAAKAASESLNLAFTAEGLPAFVTRIGLHVGEAIVGNLGSEERMDYTVLGSSVNLAARLEGLNKEYGTSVLVSDAVRERAQRHFRFRPVASVTAKGMTSETRVYELVAAVVA